MPHESNPLKRASRKPSPPPSDPLAAAKRGASDARDIAAEVARAHPVYTLADPDEITQNIHIHLPQASQPEIAEPVNTELKRPVGQWVKLVVGAAVTAILGWLAAHLGPKP